jgi:excisionase family DNA binding protein
MALEEQIVKSEQGRYYREKAATCRHLAQFADALRSQLMDMAEGFESRARDADHSVAQRPEIANPKIAAPEQTLEPVTRSIKDTAQLLGLGRSTIYRLIGEGQLETVKIGNRTLVKAASIRALAESND